MNVKTFCKVLVPRLAGLIWVIQANIYAYCVSCKILRSLKSLELAIFVLSDSEMNENVFYMDFCDPTHQEKIQQGQVPNHFILYCIRRKFHKDEFIQLFMR